MTWIESLNPRTLVRAIGIVEILGALGLVLPALTGILPWLTLLAAGGLILTMIGAIVLHIRRHDATSQFAPSFVLMLIAIFIVYGRAVAVPLV